MKKSIILLGFCVLFSHLSTAQKNEFSWLVGTWKLKDKNVFESWKVAKDGKTLEGTSYRVKGADTVVMEEVRFTYDGNVFHYIPDVAGEQGPVDFKITSNEESNFVAENPQHDFPKIIRYNFVRKENRDQIEAFIEGNGKVIPYFFERVR